MSDAPSAAPAPNDTATAATVAAAETAGPSMVPSLRMMLPNLIVAGVFPVVGYALLRPHVDSDAAALAIVLVFPVAEVLYERIRRGRFEPIGIISMVSISIGLIGALAF